MVEEFSPDLLDSSEKKNIEIFVEKLMECQKPLILFGAGEAGHWVSTLLSSARIYPDFFCDNDSGKHGTTFAGRPVISLEELCEGWRDSHIVITSPGYENEIKEQLRSRGLQACITVSWLKDKLGAYSLRGLFHQIIYHYEDEFSQVFRFLFDSLSKQVFYDFINYRNTGNRAYLVPLNSSSAQYFEKDIVTLSDDEIFIDGGAYTGDTVESFLKETQGKFKKIYAFEPDKGLGDMFENKHGGNKNIVLMPYGLWSKKDKLGFKMNAESPAANRITGHDEGGIQIPVISIDEVLQDEPVTFIKMDIEGAEMEALKGAEQTIRKHKPKLAICVYHKPLDMIEISLYIKKLVPEYRIYLRHYSDNFTETVLYALP